MSFLIHSISNSNVVPMEYYPCATKAVIGTPMLMISGALVEYGIGATLADMSGYPIYISMGVNTTAETVSDITEFTTRIPVIRVRDDIVFEADCKDTSITAGTVVVIGKEISTEAATEFDYFVEKATSGTAQFEVIEVKNTGSTVQKVLIRYIG